jgi:hypothetical protein
MKTNCKVVVLGKRNISVRGGISSAPLVSLELKASGSSDPDILLQSQLALPSILFIGHQSPDEINAKTLVFKRGALLQPP